MSNHCPRCHRYHVADLGQVERFMVEGPQLPASALNKAELREFAESQYELLSLLRRTILLRIAGEVVVEKELATQVATPAEAPPEPAPIAVAAPPLPTQARLRDHEVQAIISVGYTTPMYQTVLPYVVHPLRNPPRQQLIPGIPTDWEIILQEEMIRCTGRRLLRVLCEQLAAARIPADFTQQFTLLAGAGWTYTDTDVFSVIVPRTGYNRSRLLKVVAAWMREHNIVQVVLPVGKEVKLWPTLQRS